VTERHNFSVGLAFGHKPPALEISTAPASLSASRFGGCPLPTSPFQSTGEGRRGPLLCFLGSQPGCRRGFGSPSHSFHGGLLSHVAPCPESHPGSQRGFVFPDKEHYPYPSPEPGTCLPCSSHGLKADGASLQEGKLRPSSGQVRLLVWGGRSTSCHLGVRGKSGSEIQ
jgi:hypothetical protein